MSAIQLAVKVDVCTYAGLQRGVPALMRLFDEFNLRASFFVACGPDHSGRAIRRIFRPGFLRKMRRTSAVSTYGWRTVLYGTLLPGPRIASSFPDTLRALARNGHEVGLHGYDHVYWQDRLAGLPIDMVAAEIERGRHAFRDALGEDPTAFGAPGWQCTPASFAAEDEAGFVYHSDTRGRAPYLPAMGGQCFRTLEIPTTTPTLDETYGEVGTSAGELTAFYRDRLRPGLNVHTAHAEMEGMAHMPLLRDLLESVRAEVRFTRLIDVAEQTREAPVGQVARAPIAGRAGTVAQQEAERG
ncbi:MAG: polysaccharide deacetylase family protein [Candidatus Binatia bacterium]